MLTRTYPKKTFKQASAKKQSNSSLVVCLLGIVIILLICILASIAAVAITFETQSNSEDTQNMKAMARDMQTVMPQIKTAVPQITSITAGMAGNDLNITKLMNKLNGFDDLDITKLMNTVNDFEGLAGDIKTFIPNIKTAMPTITKLVENNDFNVTKLIRQLNDFDALAKDMKGATPQIKKVLDSLEDTDMNKMMDKFHDLSDVVDKLQTNPMSLLIDGAFEANTDMSRWRAVALKAANILQKLTKVDYSVSVLKPTWDTVQYCDGKWDSGFDGQDKDVYKLDDKNACEDFNVNTSMFTKGFGTCEWRKHDCESKDDDDSKKAFRWMRHAGGSRQQIIPKSASDDLQLRFAHYQKFASDFAGKQVPKLEPAAVVDFPLYLSNLMGVVQPSLLLNVINATDFLEKRSLSKMFCEPGSGKERQNSCEWVDDGYQFAIDNTFKIILRITRAMARNVHKAWVA